MRRWGIQTRLVLATALLLAATIGALATIGWRYQRRILAESLESKAMTLAESLSRWMAFPLAAGDADGVRRLLEAFSADPDLLAVEVVDAKGDVLMRSGAPLPREAQGPAGPGARGIETARWLVLSGGLPVYECSHPVTLTLGGESPKWTGSLRLAFAWRRGAETLAGLRRTLLEASLLLVGFGVALAVLAGSRLVGPLGRLTAAAEAVAGGDLDATAPASGPGEVGRLAEAFTRMTARRDDRCREPCRGRRTNPDHAAGGV